MRKEGGYWNSWVEEDRYNTQWKNAGEPKPDDRTVGVVVEIEGEQVGGVKEVAVVREVGEEGEVTVVVE